jgi:anthranilate/para-aminobenzoate synthase component I
MTERLPTEDEMEAWEYFWLKEINFLKIRYYFTRIEKLRFDPQADPDLALVLRQKLEVLEHQSKLLHLQSMASWRRVTSDYEHTKHEAEKEAKKEKETDAMVAVKNLTELSEVRIKEMIDKIVKERVELEVYKKTGYLANDLQEFDSYEDLKKEGIE